MVFISISRTSINRFINFVATSTEAEKIETQRHGRQIFQLTEVKIKASG